MAFGNPRSGLLKAIIDVFCEAEPGDTFRTEWVTEELIRRGHWSEKVVKSPGRTVNSYCSQNPHIFSRFEPGDYAIDRAYYRKRSIRTTKGLR